MKGEAVTVTPIYAGILTIMFIVLTSRVIGARRSARVMLGDGGDRHLLRRQRAHGNFTEYVPLALILMALAEMQGMPPYLLHAIGIGLLLGRLTHAYALGCDPEPIRLRVLGMMLTLAALMAGAIGTLSFALAAALAGNACPS